MKPINAHVRLLAGGSVVEARVSSPIELNYWQGAMMALAKASRRHDTEVVMALLNWTFSPYAWDEVEARDAEDMVIAANLLSFMGTVWSSTGEADFGGLAARRAVELKAVASSSQN